MVVNAPWGFAAGDFGCVTLKHKMLTLALSLRSFKVSCSHYIFVYMSLSKAHGKNLWNRSMS